MFYRTHAQVSHSFFLSVVASMAGGTISVSSHTSYLCGTLVPATSENNIGFTEREQENERDRKGKARKT